MQFGRLVREGRLLRAKQHARYALTSESDRISRLRHIKKEEEDGPLVRCMGKIATTYRMLSIPVIEESRRPSSFRLGLFGSTGQRPGARAPAVSES